MKAKTERKRLDVLLVERGLAESSHKAQAMILAGEVEVEQQRADKAGVILPETAHIEVHSRQQKYASRGGLKLEGALADFHRPRLPSLSSATRSRPIHMKNWP